MPALLDDSQRSNLTFVVGVGSTESKYGEQLRRVREPVSRSKSGVQGKVADVLNGRSRHAESQNELRAFQVLMATARADAWQEQPFAFDYYREGTRHRYTPDILVTWGTRREVVEVKEDSEADLAENQARFTFISELLAEHGYHFRLWRKSEICAEPRLTNVHLVLRYRCVAVGAAEHERIRRAFCTVPETTLRTLCQASVTSIQTVLHLVLEGTLHIDWWEPLGLDSKVSIRPIGRAVWPCPPSLFLQNHSEEAKCHAMR
jgi:hypothetical protein